MRLFSSELRVNPPSTVPGSQFSPVLRVDCVSDRTNASCGQITEVTTTKDEKNQFLVTFLRKKDV